MRTTLASLCILGKLSLLGCFSLFGGHCGVAEAAEISPCHQVATEKHVGEEEHTPPCGQCENSVKTWSTPVSVFSAEKKIYVPATFVFPPYAFQKELPCNKIVLSPAKRPPDDLFTRTFQRVAKSTQWRSSEH